MGPNRGEFLYYYVKEIGGCLAPWRAQGISSWNSVKPDWVTRVGSKWHGMFILMKSEHINNIDHLNVSIFTVATFQLVVNHRRMLVHFNVT